MGVVIAVFAILGVAASFLTPPFPDTLDSKLSLLNLKYGLTEAEALGDGKLDVAFTQSFSFDFAKTNVLNALKPQKELILKIQNEEEDSLQNIFLLKLRTDLDLEKIAQEYRNLDGIDYVEQNYSINLDGDGAVTKSSRNNKVKTSNFNDKSVIVAVIDSGVDVSHSDLSGKFVDGWDFLKNRKLVTDELGHGTHIAGIITKNSASAKIMPLKFTDGKNGKVSDLIKAIKYASDNGAKIINLSLGLTEKSSALKEAIDYATKKNIYIVAAAGNYNSSDEYYPAAYSKVFAVAALDKKGNKLYQSDFGKWVDYSVQAQDVYSTLPKDTYGYGTGTSQAAPFLTAKIADIISSDKITGVSSLSSNLKKTSKKVSDKNFTGLLGRELSR